METSRALYSLLGGGLIGLAVTLMLVFNGRVTGISGIISSSFSRPSRDGMWRWVFLGGMILGGALMQMMMPDLFTNSSGRTSPLIVVAGLLVGNGTVLGIGCTSGHGICGISRLSVRSIIATITFMFFGFLAVQAVRFLAGDF